jgi:aryl-alcohol dehydrogenase-like predicted oxidoreductase
MQQRTLGPDGPAVGAIGLGTGPIAAFANRPTPTDSVRVLARAAEVGVTLWDTADAYCYDESEIGYGERIVAQARAALPADLRERIVVATKGGTIRPEGRWEQDGRPEHLRAAVDASLRALQTDCIDLYQLHAPDAKVPFADTIGAIAEAYNAGKIRRVGLSNVSPEQIDEAVAIVPIVCVQNQYSLGHRKPEQDGTLEKCRELSLAFLPYSPLGGVSGAKEMGHRSTLVDVAEESGASPQAVALAWLLSKYERIIPIPGVSRIETIEDSARAADLTLSNEQIKTLDAAFA